eukprot:contig_10752_g2566
MVDSSPPMDIEEEVTTLLQSRRYDPEILPTLEAYVEHQVATGTNDAMANLATLKLYQFYPATYRTAVVSKILIKAIMALPSTDFLCATYLIPAATAEDEPIPALAQLASMLETGRFEEFWPATGAVRQLLDGVPGFDEAVRSFMLVVIGRTYKRVERTVLARLLGLEGVDEAAEEAAVEEVIKTVGWKAGEGGMVVVPGNGENEERAKTVGEQLTFRQVAFKMLRN